MKKPNPRLLYLLPLLLGVALIVFGEALSDLWKEDIKALFQQNKWLLLAFVLLLALVGFLWERQQRSEKTAPEAVDKDQYEEAFVQFRKNLLEQYQIRLRAKTANRLPINLRAKPSSFGTNPERVKVYFDKDLTIESEDITSEIGNILDTHQRLLLIGDPGAGKTTILLYAAINILNTSYSSDDFESSDEARPLRSDGSKSSDRSNSKSPDRSKLPLILNLATWREGRDFAEWYAQSIAHTYSLSPVFVQELLLRNAVVPFFDGFDEVAEQYRDDCFQKMAAYFGDRRDRQLIVSSRKKEYAATKADAPVYAEIEVQPLSLAQIKKALSENAQSQAADRALLHALDRDRWLAEAVETPFYLNTASFLFGKGQRTLADFPFEAGSTEGRQAELVEIFVAEQVPAERDRKHLHFLAEKMEVENFLVFELVKMQPGWCKNLWWYRLVGSEIETEDIRIWRWHTFIKKWKKEVFVRILLNTWKITLFLCVLPSIFGLVALRSVTGLILGVIFGLVLSLVIHLGFYLTRAGTTTNFLLHLHNPYQRFWATFKVFSWEIPTIVLSIVMGWWFVILGAAGFFKLNLSTNIQDLSFWNKFLPTGLIMIILSFKILNSKIPDHFSLRLVLYLEGKMPPRVVTFMDRMSEQLIFEDNRRTVKGKKRRGATWRFRHKILQDYFAGHSS